MADRRSPRFKEDDIVADAELKVTYVISRLSHYQLNGSPWYHAKRYEDGGYAQICDDWLTLIQRAKKKPSR